MQKNEAAYLLAVGVLLLAIFSLSLNRYSQLTGLWHKAAATESSGKPRTINIAQIRTLINQGQLAGHEAKFYTPSPGIEEAQLPALPSKN